MIAQRRSFPALFPVSAAVTLLACGSAAMAGPIAGVPALDPGPVMPEFRQKWGVEVSYYHQEQPYELAGIPSLNLPPIPGGYQIIDPSLSGIENELDHTHVKFDYDVLPFLNLFAVVGWVDGQTSLNASGTLTQATLPPTMIPIALPFSIDYNGLVYGIGTTLSYGGENWFTSLTAFYSRTDVDVRASEVDALAIMPRVGYRWGGLSVWIGAMYLETDEEHQGIYNVNLGPPFGAIPVSYAMTLRQQEDINYLIGANYEFNDDWNCTLEFGLGDRESAQIGVQRRW